MIVSTGRKSRAGRRPEAPLRRAGVQHRRSSAGFRRSFFGIALLVVTALAYIWGNVRTVSQRETMVHLQRERESLQRAQERLKADLSGMKQSSRLRRRAEALGLVFPTDPPSNLYLVDPLHPAPGFTHSTNPAPKSTEQ